MLQKILIKIDYFKWKNLKAIPSRKLVNYCLDNCNKNIYSYKYEIAAHLYAKQKVDIPTINKYFSQKDSTTTLEYLNFFTEKYYEI